MENNIKMNYGYNSQSIDIAEGAKKHRMYPGQYLGATDSEGIFNQFVEIYDNAIDEMVEWYTRLHSDENYGKILNGAKLPPLILTIEIKDDWTVIIDDMGRGLPCDYPVDENGNVIPNSEPAIFPIFEKDSAGGKSAHAQGGYSTGTAGMHGAGASVAKSCTHRFDVIARSGSGNGVYSVRYVEGERVIEGDNGLVYISPLSYEHPIEEYRKYNIPYTGTRIEYLFDETVLTPTYEGRPCDPYGEQELINRIRQSLLGIEDRDCIVVDFTFKGEYTRITPYDVTPESIIGFDGTQDLATNPCLQFSICSSPTAVGTPSEFQAKIYINTDLEGFSFSDTVIVNRLEMKKSTSTAAFRDILHRLINDEVKVWIEKHPDVRVPSKSVLNFAKYFKTCTIMSLPKASFSKQQKDDLKSTAYLEGFKEELTSRLEANRAIFKPIVNKAIESIKRYSKGKIEEEKALKAKQASLEKELSKEAIKKEIDARVNTLEGQILNREEGKKSRIKIKHSHQPVNISRVGFFEGDNAGDIINPLINSGEPLVAVTLSGKLPNIYNIKNEDIESVKRLVFEVFAQPYLEYLIFTDPDPDGAHIRMQIIALIAEYAPQMLYQERVFVIRAPFGKVRVHPNQVITIQNEFEGTLTLGEGDHYINSYDEMKSAVNQGAEYLLSFSGALDVMAGCKDIPIKTMLSDPRYKVPIKCPTAQDLQYLKDMLTPGSSLKQNFTNSFCTQRKLLSKYSKLSGQLKLKTGKNSLTSVAYNVSDTPTFANYQDMSFNNILLK